MRFNAIMDRLNEPARRDAEAVRATNEVNGSESSVW